MFFPPILSRFGLGWAHGILLSPIDCPICHFKLDGVAPLITDHPQTICTILSQKKWWYVTRYMWHVTCDTCQVEGGEPSLKMSAPLLLPFGNEGVLKLFNRFCVFRSCSTYTPVTNWVGDFFVQNSSKDCQSLTGRAEILRECSSPTLCHMSHVTCHVSRVRCHMSFFSFFSWTKWWS